MIDRLNKTSICSIIFLDIIDYSKKSVSEQIDEKAFFNALINEAIENVGPNDRIILDTGDGAAIALMGEPEEALFISLTIRDRILHQNKSAGQPLEVRIGINLGSVRVVSDINGRPNIIGDGINVAQRIMSFAGENEILVSRSYYEATSRLTKEMSGMFTYSGVMQDKHIREHEVYLIKPKQNEELEGEEVKSDKIEVAENAYVELKNQKVAINLPGVMLINTKKVLIAGIGLLMCLGAWYFFSIQSNSFLVKPSLASEVTANIPAKDSAKTQTVTDGHKAKLAKKHGSSHQQHSVKAEPIQTDAAGTTKLRKSPTVSSCSQAVIAMGQCRN